MTIEKKFKCIKELIVEQRDEEENVIENEIFVVPVGSIWYKRDFSYLSDIRLEGDFGWLEIVNETLTSHFEEI